MANHNTKHFTDGYKLFDDTPEQRRVIKITKNLITKKIPMFQSILPMAQTGIVSRAWNLPVA